MRRRALGRATPVPPTARPLGSGNIISRAFALNFLGPTLPAVPALHSHRTLGQSHQHFVPSVRVAAATSHM